MKNNKMMTLFRIIEKKDLFIPFSMKYGKNNCHNHNDSLKIYPSKTIRQKLSQRLSSYLFKTSLLESPKIINVSLPPLVKNHVTFTYELCHYINGKKHIIEYDPNDYQHKIS